MFLFFLLLCFYSFLIPFKNQLSNFFLPESTDPQPLPKFLSSLLQLSHGFQTLILSSLSLSILLCFHSRNLAPPHSWFLFFTKLPPCSYHSPKKSPFTQLHGIPLFSFLTCFHPLSCSFVQRCLSPQPPPWQGGDSCHMCQHATHLESRPPLLEMKCSAHSGGQQYPLVQEGSTNMPLFGRVHECKEYEHQTEKKV